MHTIVQEIFIPKDNDLTIRYSNTSNNPLPSLYQELLALPRLQLVVAAA